MTNANHRLLRGSLACLFAMLAGCASLQPAVPEGYSGPTALLVDSGFQESAGLAAFFAAVEIDGRPIENSIRESLELSRNRYYSILRIVTMRKVPATKLKVRIVANYVSASGIQGIIASFEGKTGGASGIVDFNPVPGAEYIVTGELEESPACVWIAEKLTKTVVTEKVCRREA